MKVMKDPGTWLPTGDAAHRAATDAELAQIAERIEAGLKQGALAVGMGINYTAAATRGEVLNVFRVAARYGAPVHVHLRYAGDKPPETGRAALEEVLTASGESKAPLHVVHVTSMGLRDTPQLLAMIRAAKARGSDVTTECYPYVAGSTGLESALFDPGWQERMRIGYGDLQWVKTGERLTAETFERYRKEGGQVVIFMIPENVVRLAVADPMVMIASDGMPSAGASVHPRGQGTFARVLGKYVREEKALDLMTALRKMTLMPAQRLEQRAPAFKTKGRIKLGADADITVFDANRVIDAATFEKPLQYSQGIRFVLVNGVAVVSDGKEVAGVLPGRAARASITSETPTPRQARRN
jgi:dihydroorotase